MHIEDKIMGLRVGLTVLILIGIMFGLIIVSNIIA